MTKGPLNEGVLKVMLNYLNKDELIENYISALNSILKTLKANDKLVKDLTHEIVTYCQLVHLSRTPVDKRKEELDKYKEPHRSELYKRLLEAKVDMVGL